MNDEEATLGKKPGRIDTTLRKHLEAIQREETPERLLVLAQELQRLLRRTPG